MTQFAKQLFAAGFATGYTHYEDHYYIGQEDETRIVLPITLAHGLKIPAIVDTGAPWCVLDPDIAEFVMDAALAVHVSERRLLVRGVLYPGKLFRIPFQLNATEGQSLEIEATVFVPTLQSGEQWFLPNFLGLDGFLNRIRFAVDPGENLFYFGPV